MCSTLLQPPLKSLPNQERCPTNQRASKAWAKPTEPCYRNSLSAQCDPLDTRLVRRIHVILCSPRSCLLDQPVRVNVEVPGHVGTYVRGLKEPLASWAAGGGRQRTDTRLAEVRTSTLLFLHPTSEPLLPGPLFSQQIFPSVRGATPVSFQGRLLL